MPRTILAVLLCSVVANAAHAQDPAEPQTPSPLDTPTAAEAPPPTPAPAAAAPAPAETPPAPPPPAQPAAAEPESEKPFVERAVIRGAHGLLAGTAAGTTMLGAAGAGYVFYQLAVSDPTFIGELSAIDDVLFAALTLGTWFFAPLAAVAVAAASVWMLGGSSPAFRVALDGLLGVGLGGLISGVPGAALGALIGLGLAALSSGSDPGVTLLLVGMGAGLGFVVVAPLGAAAGAVGGSAIGGFLGADPDTFEWE